MIVADTDVLVDALRGRDPAASRVARELRRRSLATTTVTVFELLSGAKRDGQLEKIEQLLAPLTVLPLDQAAGRTAAELRRHLEGRGMTIGMGDYLIAGICCARSVPLITRNRKHFERIPTLVLGEL